MKAEIASLMVLADVVIEPNELASESESSKSLAKHNRGSSPSMRSIRLNGAARERRLFRMVMTNMS